jgi:hypothetical protein
VPGVVAAERGRTRESSRGRSRRHSSTAQPRAGSMSGTRRQLRSGDAWAPSGIAGTRAPTGPTPPSGTPHGRVVRPASLALQGAPRHMSSGRRRAVSGRYGRGRQTSREGIPLRDSTGCGRAPGGSGSRAFRGRFPLRGPPVAVPLAGTTGGRPLPGTTGGRPPCGDHRSPSPLRGPPVAVRVAARTRTPWSATQARGASAPRSAHVRGCARYEPTACAASNTAGCPRPPPPAPTSPG